MLMLLQRLWRIGGLEQSRVEQKSWEEEGYELAFVAVLGHGAAVSLSGEADSCTIIADGP